MAKLNISMDDWVVDEIVGSAALKNRSARIQELVIKGYMLESSRKNDENAVYRFLTHELGGGVTV